MTKITKEKNDRFIFLRKYLKISQEEMGKALGISKSGVSNIESGQRNVTDKHIKLLISSFNVNEKWLRYGIEPMILPNIKNFIDDPSLDIADREILNSYIRMTPSQRQFIKSWIKHISAAITDVSDNSSSNSNDSNNSDDNDSDNIIKEDDELKRRKDIIESEFLSEKMGKILSVSTFTNGHPKKHA